MMALGDYIRDAANRPFKWGEHDCCTFCANWAAICTQSDILDWWKGAYDNELDALNLIHENGGLYAIFSNQLGKHGREVATPDAGCIGLMKTKGQKVGAIFSGERWIVLSEKGIRAFPHKPNMVSAMWAINHG